MNKYPSKKAGSQHTSIKLKCTVGDELNKVLDDLNDTFDYFIFGTGFEESLLKDKYFKKFMNHSEKVNIQKKLCLIRNRMPNILMIGFRLINLDELFERFLKDSDVYRYYVCWKNEQPKPAKDAIQFFKNHLSQIDYCDEHSNSIVTKYKIFNHENKKIIQIEFFGALN